MCNPFLSAVEYSFVTGFYPKRGLIGENSLDRSGSRACTKQTEAGAVQRSVCLKVHRVLVASKFNLERIKARTSLDEP